MEWIGSPNIKLLGKSQTIPLALDSTESPGRSWVIHCKMTDIRVFLSNLSDN